MAVWPYLQREASSLAVLGGNALHITKRQYTSDMIIFLPFMQTARSSTRAAKQQEKQPALTEHWTQSTNENDNQGRVEARKGEERQNATVHCGKGGRDGGREGA